MKTYEQRVAEMHTPADAEVQLNMAKRYARRLHLKAKDAKLTLAQKLEIHAQAKEADKVLRKIRVNIFDLEDALAAKCAKVATA